MKRFTHDLETVRLPRREVLQYWRIVYRECGMAEQHAVSVVMEYVSCPADAVMVSEFAASLIWRARGLLPCGSNG